MTPTRPLSEKCITFFDFLRFSLAHIVLVGHGIGFFYGYWGGFFPNQVPYPQQIAVVGFFLVSGFLICRSVMANLKYKGADAARYFSDRFSRTYTTLIPSLLFVSSAKKTQLSPSTPSPSSTAAPTPTPVQSSRYPHATTHTAVD